MKVKFISYDGAWPSLCSGRLTLEAAGTVYEFPEYCLSSGGSVSFTPDGYGVVTQGPWSIHEWPTDFPEELKEAALNVVNDNIPWGCCGGCA